MKLNRNYIENPLKKGEQPDLEDIRHLFLELNLSREECAKICNCSPDKIKKFCQKNKLEKTKEQRNELRKRTTLTKYGCTNISQLKEVKEKKIQTTKSNYGVDNPAQSKIVYNRIKETNLDRYNVESTNSLESKKKQIKQTLLDKYNVENIMELQEYRDKVDNTKRQNGTFNTSIPEDKVYKMLSKLFRVERQYKSEEYPFKCDFYLPELDLYIEYNGSWTHGGFPFEDVKEGHEQLERWKQKAENSDFYKNAIIVWTIRDPLKRQTAKENKLNWIEFFSFKDFIEWYNNICEILK